jgi:hypothetical protein
MNPDYHHAGPAALSLLESLLLHLEDTGIITADDRAAIFEDAIGAHKLASTHRGDAHAAIAELLHRLCTRTDGVKVVGERRA